MEHKTYHGRPVIWSPQPRQAAFMARTEDEALYGGAAGGGKSDALIIEALRQVHIPHYRALILRKTYPQLSELIDKTMKGNEPLYDFYKQTLTDNGWINADAANDQSASQSGGVDMAAMLAKNYAKKGYSAWAIMNNMSQNGYSDDEIARALEKAGVKG